MKAALTRMSLSELAEEVVFSCRVQKCFAAEKSKIVFALAGELVDERKALIAAWKSVGGTVMTGKAPRNGHERALQELLDG